MFTLQVQDNENSTMDEILVKGSDLIITAILVHRIPGASTGGSGNRS
jgi:hypothetical protein